MLSVTSISWITLVITLIWLSFIVSSKLRYYLKISILVLAATVLPFFLVPLMLIKPRDYRNGWIAAYITSFIGYTLGVTHEIEGLENVDKKKGGVIVINHQCGLDFILIARLFPKIGRAAIVAKLELAYQCPPFGLASWLCGFVFINRKDRSSAHRSINKQQIEISKNHKKLVIFPEGTRNESSELLSFKKGPFHVAIASQTSIQPVIVSKYHYFDSKRALFGRGKSLVKILPEISTKGMTKEDVDQLMETTRKIMQDNFSVLTNTVNEDNEMKWKQRVIKDVLC